MTDYIAVDSNIIIYSFDEEENIKQVVALKLIAENPFFSSQALSEVINVCRKKWKYNKDRLIGVSEFLLANCRLIPLDETTVRLSHTLLRKYNLQYFDSLIVASALQANCTILYSEDMQHNQLIENKLRIIDPYI